MTIEYDEKGKIFTDIISKLPIPATIQTVTHRIHGKIHVGQARRIKDELDLPEKFMAITEAVIYAADGQVLYQTNFLAVERDQIVWVMPDDEKAGAAQEGEA